MGKKDTLAVQIDTDSELYRDFQEYKQAGGFESTSETLRDLMRSKFYRDDDEKPVGLAAALSKVAGDELTLQLQLLSRYIVALAVALLALEFDVFGGPAWIAVAVFFGFLTFTTFLGVAVGFAGIVNPSGMPSPSPSPADDTDEVEA